MAKTKRAPARVVAGAQGQRTATRAGGASRQGTRPGGGRAGGSARRSGPQRGRSLAWVWIAITLVVVVVVVLVVVKVTGSNTSAGGRTAAQPAIVHAVTNVPVSALNQAGFDASSANLPVLVTGKAAALTSNGLPELFWAGAEYCPHCAADRWSVVAALSRFGTFSNLGAIQSAEGSIHTFSFYGSSYSSPYIVFTPLELNSNQAVTGGFATLQTPDQAQLNLLNTYNKPPYSSTTGGIPFMDFGNRYVIAGEPYSPTLIEGLSAATIAASLASPTQDPGKSIDQGVNLYTAVICKLTGGKPGNVCGQPAVQKASAAIPKR